MVNKRIANYEPISLVSSHRSLRRLPKTALSSIGINKRHGISSRRTPKDGVIFGPGGRFLQEGYKRGLTYEPSEDPAVLEAQLPSDIPGYRAEFVPISKYLL